jgi:hypothetical protein
MVMMVMMGVVMMPVMVAAVMVAMVVMVENLVLRGRHVGGVDGDRGGGEAEGERRGQQEFFNHLLRP